MSIISNISGYDLDIKLFSSQELNKKFLELNAVNSFTFARSTNLKHMCIVLAMKRTF